MSTFLTLEPWYRACEARAVDAMGFALPASFGDVAAEEHHVHQAVGLFDRSYRGVLDLEGKNVREVMDRVVSSSLSRLEPGQGQLATVLTAKGRMLAGFQLFLLPGGGLRLVLLEPGRESVTRGIHKYAFLSDIAVLDRSAEIAIVALAGPRVVEVLTALAPNAALPERELGTGSFAIAGVDVTVVRARETAETGCELWIPRGALAAAWELLVAAVREAGGGPCGHLAAETLRIEAGVARQGVDYDEDNFPNDVGWDIALTYDKCYVGQEIVARMRTYGQANRALKGVLFAPGALPEAPSTLNVGSDEAGRLSSVSFSTRLGRGVGLAMVKRKHWEAKSAVVASAAGPCPCEIVNLPIVRLDGQSGS